MIRCFCECGSALDLPSNFFDGHAAEFWSRHGHAPHALLYQCQTCGAERTSGPALYHNLKLMALSDRAWANEHRHLPYHARRG